MAVTENNMFRPLRKKKKEISTEEAKKLLNEVRRGTLAVNGDNGYPYAVPINFWYDEASERIYFHGARVGHKAEAIEASDKVCFTVWGNETVKEEVWAPYLQSVVVFGSCHAVNDEAMAKRVLRKFAMKYYPNEELVEEEILASGMAVQMYEIEIQHMSGKEIQEK